MPAKIVRVGEEGSVDEVARVLLAGGVAVIPTDTVYGLAAHPARPEAVERLYAVKGRPDGKPIALLASSAAAVRGSGAAFPPAAEALAARGWPGALTLVLPCGGGFEGFRVPDCAWTAALLEKCGGLLRVTSANLSGARAATSFAAAFASLGRAVDIAVDGGETKGGVASTVVKATPSGALDVLRKGPLRV